MLVVSIVLLVVGTVVGAFFAMERAATRHKQQLMFAQMLDQGKVTLISDPDRKEKRRKE